MTDFTRGKWLQTFMSTTSAEKAFAEYVDTAKAYGFDGIIVKAFDGTDWMSKYDPGVDALGSLAGVRGQKAYAEGSGLGYAVWVNPLFGERSFLDRQAQLYAYVGQITGCIYWDTEPYTGFWGGERVAGEAAYLMQAFRDQALDCWNVWQPDPRAAQLERLHPDEWAPHMNSFSPQVYSGDFGVRAVDALEQFAVPARQYGLVYHPTLRPHTMASSQEFLDAVNWLRLNGSPGFTAYVLGEMNGVELQAIHDAKLYAAEPSDPCAELQARYDDLQTKYLDSAARAAAQDVRFSMARNSWKDFNEAMK